MFSPPDVVEVSKARITAYGKKFLMTLILAGIVLGSASSIQADPVPVGVWQQFFLPGPELKLLAV